MSNHTSMRARDACQHKGSVVDTRIMYEDAARLAPYAGMVYHLLTCAIDQAIQTARPGPQRLPWLVLPTRLVLTLVVGHTWSTRSSCIPSMAPTRSSPAGTAQTEGLTPQFLARSNHPTAIDKAPP